VKKLGKKIKAGLKKLVKGGKKVARATKRAARRAARAAKRKAKKLRKAAKRAAKKAKRAAKKLAKKARRAAKKAAKKGKKPKKFLRLSGARLLRALKRVAKLAAAKAKAMGLKAKALAAFVKQQVDKFRSRHQPTPAGNVKNPHLKKLLKGVAKKQSRKAISKLQAALKKKKAGSVELPIKHHKITIHPRTPGPKKLKLFKPSPTDHNYVKHLKQSKKLWKKRIEAVKHAIRMATPGSKQDWPVEYGTLDPPDAGKAAMAAELYNDLKPFLKDAVSIKEQDLTEGKEGLVTMEALRWVVHDKLTKAQAQPLLPEMYRFIE